MKTHEAVFDRMDKIQNLKTLKENVDPASGMSVCIRRGVLSDKHEEDNDLTPREWISMEICENMEEIIDLLRETQINSLNLWLRSAQEDLKNLNYAINLGKVFLDSLKTNG